MYFCSRISYSLQRLILPDFVSSVDSDIGSTTKSVEISQTDDTQEFTFGLCVSSRLTRMIWPYGVGVDRPGPLIPLSRSC